MFATGRLSAGSILFRNEFSLVQVHLRKMVFNGEKKLATFFPFYLVLETFMEFIMDLDRTFNGILGILSFSPNLTNSNFIRTSNVKKRRRIPIGEALGIFFSRLQLVFFLPD